jgi:hypothetical protein
MKLTGHKTENVYRRYAIVAEADLREAGEKLTAADANYWSSGRRLRSSGAAPEPHE